MTSESKEFDLKSACTDYIYEVFEVFISLLILRALMVYTNKIPDNNLNIINLLKYSFCIGLFTFLLEYMLPNIKSYIKPMIISLVSSM
jgi:hypothetical protein